MNKGEVNSLLRVSAGSDRYRTPDSIHPSIYPSIHPFRQTGTKLVRSLKSRAFSTCHSDTQWVLILMRHLPKSYLRTLPECCFGSWLKKQLKKYGCQPNQEPLVLFLSKVFLDDLGKSLKREVPNTVPAM